MSTIKTKNIQQKVISGTTQPLNIGGILDDGSDAKISIDTSGNLTASNLTATLNGLLTTNGQIKFPATQNPSSDANTLDDYEEGTFTPTVYGSTSAGIGTYVTQNGKYTKIGNMVYATAYIAWTSHSGTGSMYAGGLPFTCINAGIDFIANVVTYNVALSANNYLSGGNAVRGDVGIGLLQQPIGGGAFSNVAMDSSGYLLFSIAYMATT